jgi:hypothetical protein
MALLLTRFDVMLQHFILPGLAFVCRRSLLWLNSLYACWSSLLLRLGRGVVGVFHRSLLGLRMQVATAVFAAAHGFAENPRADAAT